MPNKLKSARMNAACLEASVDDARRELVDYHMLLEEILTIVSDEQRWTTPHEGAFNRGRIVGMCHRAGIGLDREEPESRE